MDLHPIPTDDTIDYEEAQQRYNESASTIWELAEELGVEAVTLSAAIFYIERILDEAL